MNGRALSGLAILLAFQFAGEAVARLLPWPIPGNVVGMALLLAGLSIGAIQLAWVEAAAQVLLSRMALFFVPAGVGIMAYRDLLGREWLPISAAVIASTVAVLAVTATTERLVARWRSRAA